MAQTTWKQVVLDTADAIREANGTSEKIPVGQIADKVRAGAGTPYEGDNPLTIGQAGYNFPAKTLLKDGLQIINGVNGEDLTEPMANLDTAVDNLLIEVSRRLADHKGEGEFVWKKLTAEGGDFIDYVVSSDAEAYPDGGEQDGAWYKRIEEETHLYGVFTEEVDSNGYMTKGKVVYGKIPPKMFYMGNSTIALFDKCSNLEIVSDSVGEQAFAFAYSEFTGTGKIKLKTKSLGKQIFYGSDEAQFRFWISKDCTTIGGSDYYSAPFYDLYYGYTKIYCEVSSKPRGWQSQWNYTSSSNQASVMWGVTEEAFDAL